MHDSKNNFDKHIASLIDVTDALLRGEYDREEAKIDADGLLSLLAQKINTMVSNLRTIEPPLVHAEEQAPSVVDHAANVVELMAQSTDEVLGKSDKAALLLEELEKKLAASEKEGSIPVAAVRDLTITLKAALFDIIASQSYQDVARQKMEKLITDLHQIRDWLVEALVVLNLSKNSSAENVRKKRDTLREMNNAAAPEALKQDLVDELLAEFGF